MLFKNSKIHQIRDNKFVTLNLVSQLGDKDDELVSQNFMLTNFSKCKWIYHDVSRRNNLEGKLHNFLSKLIQVKYSKNSVRKEEHNFFIRSYRLEIKDIDESVVNKRNPKEG